MLAYKELQKKIKLRTRIKALLRPSKNKLDQTLPSEEPELMKRMRTAYESGFEFHQRELKKDPALIRWIKKDNYFDYRLPES